MKARQDFGKPMKPTLGTTLAFQKTYLSLTLDGVLDYCRVIWDIIPEEAQVISERKSLIKVDFMFSDLARDDYKTKTCQINILGRTGQS
jgi:hypothetical protein